MTESLLRVENQAVRGTAAGVRQLQRLDEDLRGAMIDASGFEASGPIKRFANTYHGLLRIAIDDNSFNTRALRAAYDSNRKIDTLLRTLEKGLAAGRPGSLGTSLLTARSSFATLLRFQQEQSGREVLKTRLDRAATPLVDQANDHDHPEVSDFVKAVKKRYPTSLLNDILVRPAR